MDSTKQNSELSNNPVTICNSTESKHHNYLDRLATELKVEVILHLNNPTSLAKCSREWNKIVNLPSTKAKWLIGRHEPMHYFTQ